MRTELPNRDELVDKLDQIVQHELAGVVRYTHYSFMIFAYSRIPVVILTFCICRCKSS